MMWAKIKQQGRRAVLHRWVAIENSYDISWRVRLCRPNGWDGYSLASLVQTEAGKRCKECERRFK